MNAPHRTRAALYVVSAWQAIALTTIQFVIPVYVSVGNGRVPSHFVANLALFSLPYLGGFVLAHAIGGLIDVTGRVKPFMLLALFAHFAGLALLAVVRAPWAILAAAALAASFTGTLNTTLKTYVTRLDEKTKGMALSRLTQAAQAGWLIGGLLTAIWLVEVTPAAAHAVIVADLVLTVGAIAVVAALLPRLAHVAGPTGHASEATRHGLVRGVLDDLDAVYREPAFVRTCLAAILLVAGNWIFVATFSVFLVDGLHAPSTSIGWLNVAGAIVALALLPAIGAVCDRRGAAAAIRLGAVSYVVCYVVLFVWPSVFAAGFVFSLPAYAALLIGLSAAAADIGGVARRGGGIGVVDGLWAVAIAIGAPAGGLVADLDLRKIPAVALAIVSVGLVVAWVQSVTLEKRLGNVRALDPAPTAAVDSPP